MIALWKIAPAVRALAARFPPLARRVGRGRLRATSGGLPAHVYDVAYCTTAGFPTTTFRFEPPFRRDGWPKDYAERPLDGPEKDPSLQRSITSRIRPPLEPTRAYFHGGLEAGVAWWFFVDESSGRGVLWELL